jgi:phosphatidylinositol alpha-1,6-mannosyltransferase
VTRWYLAFAAFAAALALFSGQPVERCWGSWAVIGYAAAAAITAAAPRRRVPAVMIALAFATAAPLAWQVWAGLPSLVGEGPLTVVAQAGGELLRHGTPYLPSAGLTRVLAYDPYEPLMAVFGLPGAAGPAGWARWAGNPRLWLTLAGAGAAYLAFRVPGARPRQALAATALAVASPVVSLQVAAGGTDIPVLALLCAAVALAGRAPGKAAVVTGIACALKATAWPAVPVIAVLLTASRSAKDGWRFAATAALTAATAMGAAAPAALTDPGTVAQNAVLFPLGLTRHRTPATSPLPGHLLATAGPAGRWADYALLATATLAAGAWLALRPPRTTRAAAARLAIALAAIFTLAPATRWGYYGYPLGLAGWLELSRPERASPSSSERTVVTSSASPSAASSVSPPASAGTSLGASSGAGKASSSG